MIRWPLMTVKRHREVVGELPERLREEVALRRDYQTRYFLNKEEREELAQFRATRAKQIANLSAANARRKAKKEGMPC